MKKKQHISFNFCSNQELDAFLDKKLPIGRHRTKMISDLESARWADLMELVNNRLLNQAQAFQKHGEFLTLIRKATKVKDIVNELTENTYEPFMYDGKVCDTMDLCDKDREIAMCDYIHEVIARSKPRHSR